jgi:hypothetical protein
MKLKNMGAFFNVFFLHGRKGSGQKELKLI